MALGSEPSEAVKTVPDFLLTKTRGPCLGGDIVMLSMGVGKIGTQGGLHIVPETAGAVPLNQVSHAHECLSFRVLANSWRSIDQLSILTHVPFDIWNGDPIRHSTGDGARMNCPPARSNLRGCRQQRSKGLD